ncbi:MAG: PEGA domain-containing protein [Muribaculaceae bacterium]|nr:PEGA domain-containing protein [Muribaculaceae bacterium]
MKKLFIYAFLLLGVLSSSAEMKIKPNSFKDFAAGNLSVGDANGLGVQDMTADIIDWPKNNDGEPGKETLSCISVVFENMAPEDIDKITPSATNGASIVLTVPKTINGRRTLQVFFDSGDNIDLDFNHPTLGTVRFPSPVQGYKPGHMYELGIINSGTASISITTEPSGAKLTFDGVPQEGLTPITIKNVKMGEHSVSISPSNPSIASPVEDETIYVSPSKLTFNYDLYKKKDVTIITDPKDADLKVYYNNQLVADKFGEATITDAPYDRKYTIVAKKGNDVVTDNLFIDENTPSTYKVKVIGVRSVTFTAKQNNKEVRGASVTLNGRTDSIGYTPLTKVLDFGTYEVTATYGGYSKTQKLKVGKKTNGVTIKIPNRKVITWNPFDTDYKKRQWGISASYVHRFFKYKKDGKTTNYNWVGEEGASNGVQVGLTYQPYFGYGQGLSTGLYYQGTFGKRLFLEPGHYAADEVTYQEDALYFPLQYQFRLPLHANTSVGVNIGAAITYGFSNKYKLTGSDDSVDIGYGYNDRYETYHPDKFDYSLLMGAFFQFKAMQIEVKYSLGLKDHSIMHTQDADMSVKSSFMSAGLSLLF